jgi:hypothetical protein
MALYERGIYILTTFINRFLFLNPKLTNSEVRIYYFLARSFAAVSISR